ncbi:MAG: DUF4091 domain-containing protein [Ruminococcaceae bacterium]|nr:DUF4091 domain-containing protein [Oscillospiraceae bacterium]
MKYCVLPSYIWTYPDIHYYPEGKEAARLLALRGGYAAFQLHVWDAEGELLTAVCEGFEGERYAVIPIPVESCPGIEEPTEHFPERKAPFKVGDCLMPIEEKASLSKGSATLYFAVPVPLDAKGNTEGRIIISDGKETAEVPVTIEASSAKIPEEKLNIAMGCDFVSMAEYHKITTREDFEKTQTQYMSLLRRQHQTHIYMHGPRPMFKNGKWEFNHEFFNKFAKKALDMGFKKIFLHGVGFRRAWDAPDIMCGKIDLLSEEGYKYLREYLTALRENLREQGWLDKDIFHLGLCDEPNDINALNYRALAGMVRKLIPEIKLYDATSGAPIYGTLDIYIPRADEYEKHRDIFDYYKSIGDEVWHYVCLYPREKGYINRFMDIPLLATRYLFWGNYRYGLTGYVHWTVNCYQSGCDPFKESCPRHVNAGSKSILPPGDDKLIYPGTDGGGWMSLRLENHRESAEEYAMLRAVKEYDIALADEICESVFHSFNSVEWSAEKFENARRSLIKAYEKATASDPVL